MIRGMILLGGWGGFGDRKMMMFFSHFDWDAGSLLCNQLRHVETCWKVLNVMSFFFLEFMGHCLAVPCVNCMYWSFGSGTIFITEFDLLIYPKALNRSSNWLVVSNAVFLVLDHILDIPSQYCPRVFKPPTQWFQTSHLEYLGIEPSLALEFGDSDSNIADWTVLNRMSQIAE